MSLDANPEDKLKKEILNFSFTVEFINAILQELGERPYRSSAGLIALIRQQGEPQFKAMLEKETAKNG